MGGTNYWQGIIVDTIFFLSIVVGLRVFEATMQYKDYSCPEYCEIDHKHIKEIDGLQIALQVDTRNRQEYKDK